MKTIIFNKNNFKESYKLLPHYFIQDLLITFFHFNMDLKEFSFILENIEIKNGVINKKVPRYSNDEKERIQKENPSISKYALEDKFNIKIKNIIDVLSMSCLLAEERESFVIPSLSLSILKINGIEYSIKGNFLKVHISINSGEDTNRFLVYCESIEFTFDN